MTWRFFSNLLLDVQTHTLSLRISPCSYPTNVLSANVFLVTTQRLCLLLITVVWNQKFPFSSITLSIFFILRALENICFIPSACFDGTILHSPWCFTLLQGESVSSVTCTLKSWDFIIYCNNVKDLDTATFKRSENTWSSFVFSSNTMITCRKLILLLSFLWQLDHQLQLKKPGLLYNKRRNEDMQRYTYVTDHHQRCTFRCELKRPCSLPLFLIPCAGCVNPFSHAVPVIFYMIDVSA